MTKHETRITPSSSPRGQEDTIDLMRTFRTLRGGWRLIATVSATLIALGLVYAVVFATPIYTATASVALDTQPSQVVDLGNVMNGLTGDSDTINTEVEVLKSRGLAAKVVEALDLTQDPEFNSRLRAPTVISRMRGLLGRNAAEPGEDQIKAAVEDALLKATQVRNVPSSYVFKISVYSEDPQKAARIANTIADLYILNQIEVKFEATRQATDWLASRAADLQFKLGEAEAKVKKFTAQTTLISRDALSALEVQLKEIRDRLARATEGVAARQARLEALTAAGGMAAKRAVAEDPRLSAIAAQLDLAAPDVSQRDFDARYEQVIARAQLDLARDQRQVQALERSAKQFEDQIAQQGEDMIKLQQLTHEADASRALYTYFLARLNETSAQQGVQQADSRMLSRAVVPVTPTAPRTGLILTLCAILGVIGGIGAVLAREALQSGFRTAREIEDATGLTVLGQIPLINAETRAAVFEYMVNKPSSEAVEAIRSLRTSVLLSDVDHPPQVILSTSALPEEGKTTTSLGLALNLAAMGTSVLLIEGDIRRNVLADYLPHYPHRRGLASVLSGQISVEDALVHGVGPGLSMLMGEPSPVNAADLFMSDAYRGFLDAMRARFDHIVIDTPPVLIVPDARIIARLADAVLLTVRWNATRRGQVREAVQMFETANQSITGVVLSQVDRAKMRRYGHGGEYAGGHSGYGASYYLE